MSAQMKLQGLGVALITPFHSDGKVDYPALQRMVEHLISGGCDFLVVLGTTAETPTLSPEEQRSVVDFVVEVNANRLPVVVGVSGNNTVELCSRIRTWDLEDIDAFLVASPAYNKPSQLGIVTHFKAVADAAPKPIVLYNVPGRTASNMSAATTLQLAKHDNVCGIKEASGDLGQIGLILAQRPEGFAVWSGDDALALPTVSMGAEGVISVMGNVCPAEMSRMIQQTAFGQIQEAQKTHQALVPIMDLLFAEGNPVGVKVALKHLGICETHVRLPLIDGSKDLTDKLYKAIAEMEVETS
jgi:4-hydroxy-tetrahydrodipicolinate synthase